MAKKEEERDSGLFDMTLGDGFIDINEDPPVKTKDESESNPEEKQKEEKKQTGFHQYDDGSFEIDTFIEEQSSEEDDTSIEKTEDKEKEKGKVPSDGGQSDSSPSSSPFLAFAKDRASEGVFLEFNDEEWKMLVERNDGDEAAALRELSSISMAEMIKDQVEAYKESLTEQDRALYEAKEKGLPIDEYGIAKRNVEKYSKIKPDDIEEDEKLQTELVSKALELRGFTPEEIVEEIDGYKTLDNLKDKAEKALAALPKFYQKKIKDLEEKAIADEESRKDQFRQKVAKMKQLVEQTPEVIPGIKLTKPTREKIMRSMTTPVAKDSHGNPLNPVMATRAKNPDAFELMLHYYHELGLFNIDDSGVMKPDFSKISKIEKTKATDQMRSIFESKEKHVEGKPNIQKDDELDEFDKAFGRLFK